MTNVTHITAAYTSISLQGAQTSKESANTGGFSALLDLVSSTDKDKNTVAAADGTDLLASIQQFIGNINAALFNIGDTGQTGASYGIPTGLNTDGTISVDALLNQGGPLPAFLDRVAARYGLDEAHKKALRDIAIQFKDTTGSQAEVAQMADALKNAGIG